MTQWQFTRPLSFEDACTDRSLIVKPVALGFIPLEAWPNEDMTFGSLVDSFFQRRNSKHCTFPFKLVNALALVESAPKLFPVIGIKWFTDTVLLVEGQSFARLLGVRTIDGSLFHQQGNFPTHGFIEISFPEAQQLADERGLEKIDSSNMRFLRHGTGAFTRSNVEFDQLHWRSA
jgi:hypothetical protein